MQRERARTAYFGALGRKLVIALACSALLIGSETTEVRGQPSAPAADSADAGGQRYTLQQLDALLAPVALYPDELLTQVLMASTSPLQVVEAARWVEDTANKDLRGDALNAALAARPWDPSVKSLVPFPQVLVMLNAHLDWLGQLGFAMETQQGDVFDSVQRLRRQSQAAGTLTSNERQVVRTEGPAIVIAPAQPDIVFVPSYNPAQAFGPWPYPAYPPVYLPPPPGYAVGGALLGGLAFGAGVAITAGLWGWARPNWGGGNVNVNVNRFNSINVNRPAINNPNWRPGGFNGNGAGLNRPGGVRRPPPGPVGAPGRPGGFPANGIGRPNVSVPGGIVRPPAGVGPGNRPPIGQGNRPPVGQGNRPPIGQGNRPPIGQGNRPSIGQGNRPPIGQGNRPPIGQGNRPSIGQGNRGTALGGINDGRAAGQFAARGSQSRQTLQRPQGGGRAAGIRPGGGGGRAGGGGRLGGRGQ